MKKLTAVILAMIMLFCLSVPVFAADDEASTVLTYTPTGQSIATPSFTVSIPGNLAFEGIDMKTPLGITVSDLKNVGSDSVVVYVSDTGNPFTDTNPIFVQGFPSDDPYGAYKCSVGLYKPCISTEGGAPQQIASMSNFHFIPYHLYNSEGNLLPRFESFPYDRSIDIESTPLAVFNDNGTKFINIELKNPEPYARLLNNDLFGLVQSKYTGYIVFGIALSSDFDPENFRPPVNYTSVGETDDTAGISAMVSANPGSGSFVRAGETITYSVTVCNNGDSLKNLNFSAVVPAGTEYCSGDLFAEITLAPGQSQTVTFSVTVPLFTNLSEISFCAYINGCRTNSVTNSINKGVKLS